MRKELGAVAAAIVLGSTTIALAHEGHVHKVMGTVVAIDATRIEVDTKEGGRESFPLTGETKYLKGKLAAALADVKVGTRVVLSVVEENEKKSVTEIIIGAEKQAPHKHEH